MSATCARSAFDLTTLAVCFFPFLFSHLCRCVAVYDCFSALSRISLADEDDDNYDRSSL